MIDISQDKIEAIHATLVDAAKTDEDYVFYSKVIQMAGIGHLGESVPDVLGHVLYLVNEFDRSQDKTRPMLSSIALSADFKMGPGFFTLAEQYGKFHDGDNEDKFRFAEEKALRAYWQSQEIISKPKSGIKPFVPPEIETPIYKEGAEIEYTGTKYERNRKARQDCILHYGTKCQVCDFDFEAVYGKVGRKYIEVHHLNPISEQDGEYEVDPIRDLRPVCPNCHAMLHRKNPPYTLNELAEMMKDASGN